MSSRQDSPARLWAYAGATCLVLQIIFPFTLVGRHGMPSWALDEWPSLWIHERMVTPWALLVCGLSTMACIVLAPRRIAGVVAGAAGVSAHCVVVSDWQGEAALWLTLLMWLPSWGLLSIGALRLPTTRGVRAALILLGAVVSAFGAWLLFNAWHSSPPAILSLGACLVLLGLIASWAAVSGSSKAMCVIRGVPLVVALGAFPFWLQIISDLMGDDGGWQRHVFLPSARMALLLTAQVTLVPAGVAFFWGNGTNRGP